MYGTVCLPAHGLPRSVTQRKVLPHMPRSEPVWPGVAEYSNLGRPMLIDLHAHSDSSDGTDSAAELIGKAAAAGLDVVAITDHDTTGGWARAAAARPAELGLIRGSEFSTQVAGSGWTYSIHLLGYPL